jgi:hypothetical protein
MSTPTSGPEDASSAEAGPLRVRVQRSGGFAGLTTTWTADSTDLAPGDVRRLRTLVDAAGLLASPDRPGHPAAGPAHPTAGAGHPAGPGHPDAFQYDIEITGAGRTRSTTVHEGGLDDATRALIDHVRGVVDPG